MIRDHSNAYRGLAMTVEINVLSEALGAEVVGLDLSSPIPKSHVAAIQRAFLDHRRRGAESTRHHRD